jgi:hypothetical protein
MLACIYLRHAVWKNNETTYCHSVKVVSVVSLVYTCLGGGMASRILNFISLKSRPIYFIATSHRYPFERSLDGPHSSSVRCGEETLPLPGTEPRYLGRSARSLVCIVTHVFVTSTFGRIHCLQTNEMHFTLTLIICSSTPTYVSVLYKAIFRGFINYVHFTSNFTMLTPCIFVILN